MDNWEMIQRMQKHFLEEQKVYDFIARCLSRRMEVEGFLLSLEEPESPTKKEDGDGITTNACNLEKLVANLREALDYQEEQFERLAQANEEALQVAVKNLTKEFKRFTDALEGK